ncbi:AEC family transporter [Duganella sp. FT92W]|uniref:AEC family transporter n=1 Tax=Pseudoduganella rivuli TaxID=2666085 RepID=A0A7X2IHX3_9BURK|nr:AEC family transporter [Pseudoduganella rivuli]MRV70339.1 AEC family transporter [Pseudoduganella rivuli]
MLDILAITTPIYLAILAGYLAIRMGMFEKSDMRLFGKFVLNIALPALLFNALAQRPIADIINPGYLLAYLAGSLLVLGAAYGAGRYWINVPPTRSAVLAMGMACSNSGYVGFPIVALVMAPVAGLALSLNVIVENVVMVPIALALAESGRHASGGAGRWQSVAGQALRTLARNPLVLSVAAGLVFSVLGWHLPSPLARTVDLFGKACAGLSLFVIGGTLVGLPLAGLGVQAAPVVAGKLLAHPLAVLLAVSALPLVGMAPLDPPLRAAAMLMAAMPMMGIYPMLAQQYGEADRSAAALLVCTVASFFTLSAWIWLLR